MRDVQYIFVLKFSVRILCRISLVSNAVSETKDLSRSIAQNAQNLGLFPDIKGALSFFFGARRRQAVRVFSGIEAPFGMRHIPADIAERLPSDTGQLRVLDDLV